MKAMFKISLLSISLILLIFGCTKKDDVSSDSLQEVKFNPSFLEEETSRINTDLDGVEKILFSIMSGEEDIFHLEEIELYKLPDGEFFSAPFLLSEGSFQLTFFALVDTEGDIQYVTPLANSDMAQYVDHPLPINFSVTNNETTVLYPEIVPAENGGTGYAQFGHTFDLVEVLEVSVSVLKPLGDGTSVLTDASLAVDAFIEDEIDWFTTKQIPASTSVVGLKSSLPISQYEFHIEKEGYKTISHLVSAEELESHPVLVFTLDPTEDVSEETFTQNIAREVYCCPGSGYYSISEAIVYDNATQLPLFKSTERLINGEYQTTAETTINYNEESHLSSYIEDYGYDQTTIDYEVNAEGQVTHMFMDGGQHSGFPTVEFSCHYEERRLSEINLSNPDNDWDRKRYRYSYDDYGDISDYSIDYWSYESEEYTTAIRVSFSYIEKPNIFPFFYTGNWMDRMMSTGIYGYFLDAHFWTGITPTRMIAEYNVEVFDFTDDAWYPFVELAFNYEYIEGSNSPSDIIVTRTVYPTINKANPPHIHVDYQHSTVISYY